MLPSRQSLPAHYLELVFDSLGAGVYVIDREGAIVVSNALTEELLGYDQDDMLGQPAHTLFHHTGMGGRTRAQETCPLFLAAHDGVAATTEDDVFVRSDGSLLPVAWAATPIADDLGRPDGAVVVFRDITLRASTDMARLAEVALANDERDASQAESDRVTFLARVSEALSSTLDVTEAVTRLSRLVVPRLADWCVIDLVADGRVERAAVAHRMPRALDAVAEVGSVTLPLPDADDRSSLGVALQGGPPQVVVIDDLPASMPTVLGEAQADLFRRLGGTRAIVVGLVARQHVIGAVSLVRDDPSWIPDRAEVAMAEDIGRRAAMALDNIRLYEEQRGTAEALQRTLLPELPDIDGIELCATYAATRRSAEVGGDWYDAIPVDDHRTLIVLGDVAGHDLQAAVEMSAIRTLLRAATLHSDDPAAILSEVDLAMARFVDTTATAIVACVDRRDPDRPTLAWSNAGHLAPLVLSGGTGEFLEAPPDVLLGAAAGVERHTHTRALDPGSTVLLYTDGLVERRHIDITDGMERLRAAAARRRSDLSDLCAAVVNALDDEWDDDIAVIAVTLSPAPG